MLAARLIFGCFSGLAVLAQGDLLPPASRQPVDFAADVAPILEQRCLQCHGRGKAKGGFSLANRASSLAGSDSGPVLIPGRSEESYLIHLVAGVDPDNVMPIKGTRLTAAEVGVLRAWIDQGAVWDATIDYGRRAPLNLNPRRPELPPATETLSHPIDRLLASYYAAHGVAPEPVVNDQVFARRVYLDVLGLLPPPAELDAFLEDQDTGKRARLVRRLLSDEARYAEHWLTFWNDLLRNDYRGTGYIDKGRKQITGWLYRALRENKPFDLFVRELVDPDPESEGFVNGIIWRGVVNASQRPEMQTAQNISQVFMGVNLKCASCHDSFINDWTLADAYGLAGVYADGPLEMVHCDKPTGEVAPLRFLYPELGELDGEAPREERLAQLAEILTGAQNGRLSRTLVNRLWAQLLGRGLVEPVDDMEQAAWSPDLLDWLAADLVDHNYDVKHTLERILTSQAYQRASVAQSGELSLDPTFRGPLVRRLSAEEFADAVSAITGEWAELPEARAAFGLPPNLAALKVPPETVPWIWNSPDAAEGVPPGKVYWRRVFDLPATPDRAAIAVACDNRFRLWINGQETGSGDDFQKPNLIEITSRLRPGRNVLALETVNDRVKADDDSSPNPAGLWVYAVMRVTDPIEQREVAFDIVSNRDWCWSTENPESWITVEFDDSAWLGGTELGPAASGPWQAGEALTETAAAAALCRRTRAALIASNPLMTALGRPNREQVITRRSSTATTLQALELTNGTTLAEQLQHGAARLLAQSPGDADALVDRIFQSALGREAAPAERALAGAVLGTPTRREGVEDLLWAVVMLPEFQLIY